jgi:3-deoxy-7-phosphoheptulonate synthase
VHAPTKDLNVLSFEPLDPPSFINRSIPLSDSVAALVENTRQEIARALSGDDKRYLIIVGPCSIHDPVAALEYARQLVDLRKKVHSRMIVVMRVYFEKPRTTVGWKGLINDPHLDGSHDIVTGLKLARDTLLKINELGMPCATEFLDPIVPHYLSDLVSWAAIGARTTESQTHRQMASGLSMPVGFKNATDGGLQTALDAMVAARAKHSFVGIDDEGRTAIVRTKGNQNVHLVLRGGHGKANYSRADLAYTKALLDSRPGQRQIMIDCSHGNSNKNFLQQPRVFEEVLSQFLGGESSILGAMIESNLVEGKQDPERRPLTYGQSVTDGCISWSTTEALLIKAFQRLDENT